MQTCLRLCLAVVATCALRIVAVCPPGEQSAPPAGVTCEKCPLGTFTATSNSTCTACPQNSTTLSPGSTACTCITGYRGVPPSCVRVSCGTFFALNANVTSTGTQFGDTTTLACHIGYNVVGNATVQCRANGFWSSSDTTTFIPYCQAMNCGVFPLDNGAVLPLPGPAQPTTFKTIRTIVCNHGFQLTERPHDNEDYDTDPLPNLDRIECRSDGDGVSWYALAYQDRKLVPRCRRIKCAAFRLPEHGVLTRSGEYFDDLIHLSCVYGYVLSGMGVGTCLASGNWTAEVLAATCEPVKCGELQIANGNVTLSGISLGAGGTVTCVPGHRLVGISQVRDPSLTPCPPHMHWHPT